jgi:hypothetical protein
MLNPKSRAASVHRASVRETLSLPLFGNPPVSDGGNRFEPGIHAESPKQVTDVVLDRLRAQVELMGDLLGRAPLLK